MIKKELSYKEVEGKRFYYVDMGSESHGRTSFRLWVNRRLIKTDEDGKPYIEFPIQNAKIIKTEKGNNVLKPMDGFTTFDVFVRCGYRGESKFNIVEPEVESIVKYYIYRSETGSLGVSEGALVSVKGNKIKYEWERSGRTYGEPKHGVTILYADGRVEEVDEIKDAESLNELEAELE